jgi:hypothetical protein
MKNSEKKQFFMPRESFGVGHTETREPERLPLESARTLGEVDSFLMYAPLLAVKQPSPPCHGELEHSAMDTRGVMAPPVLALLLEQKIERKPENL